MDGHSDRANPRQVVVPLVRRDSVGSSHHVLTFDCDPPLLARAGQFVMVRGADWGHAPFLPRPMSLLSAGRRPSILVKVAGEGTRRFAVAEPGDRFSILGPLGRPWPACPGDRTPVLVAGGVGVCPLIFLARTLADQGKRPICLYGGRCAEDLVLEDDLADIGDVRCATEDGSFGHMGLVTSLLEKALADTGGRAKVYACGPQPMMARVFAIAQAAGVPCDVSLETVMACGFGVCLGCAVPKTGGGYLYACSDGACVDGRSVDWEHVR